MARPTWSPDRHEDRVLDQPGRRPRRDLRDERRRQRPDPADQQSKGGWRHGLVARRARRSCSTSAAGTA